MKQDLMEKVAEEANLLEALRRVCANKGSAGEVSSIGTHGMFVAAVGSRRMRKSIGGRMPPSLARPEACRHGMCAKSRLCAWQPPIAACHRRVPEAYFCGHIVRMTAECRDFNPNCVLVS